ncbi:inositol monophosphatase [Sphingosinicella sp. CPCC 101087]|uniref:inositol monophosphatase family protein n=1 Tax=Sphingosinicella sp. CPCC 101087 TaxID=2497754 RepID=UPI00101B9663|nr:inositol monophosphatase [Sphingosinicella sp. CPCC 101087]
MNRDPLERVEALMREAADRAILPRFRLLAEHEVEEKSPGELVTAADRDSEAILTAGLAGLIEGARVVGEEACAVDPALMEGLDQGLVWLVDPLDGTSNFAAGEEVFAVMVALLRDGTTVAGWMLDPLSGRLARAERGAGAWLGGERLVAPPHRPGTALRGSIGRFMPAAMEQEVVRRARAGGELLPMLKCAGADYPLLALGERDFVFYWRTLPWDHAAGALFLEEAGGKAVRPDGSAYQPASRGSGLLAASTPEAWEEAHRRLLGNA